MSKKDYIIPECFVETAMAKILLNVGDVNHQSGCNEVSRCMQKKFKDEFAVGMIDADKKQHTYSITACKICESEHLCVKKASEKSHYFILVKPAMEKFILDICQTGTSLKDLNLPDNLDGLKKITKDSKATQKNCQTLNQLFKTKCKENAEMMALKDLLAYLDNNKYNVSNEEICNIFSTHNVLIANGKSGC